MSGEQRQSVDAVFAGLEKRERFARYLSLIITLVIIVLAAFILVFTIRAIRQRIDEENTKLDAVKEERGVAEKERNQAKKESELAKEETKELESYQLTIELYREAMRQLPDDEREALLRSAEKVISQGAQNSPDAGRGDLTALTVVYLQILDSNQRDNAKAISVALKKNGIRVLGIELVRSQVSLNQTQVRVFQREYGDVAQKIITILKKSGVRDPIITPSNVSAIAGQIEVWFAPNAFPDVKPPRPPSPKPRGVPNSSLRLLVEWEGYSLTVHPDSAGLQTIGVGHLITRSEAEAGVISIGGKGVNFSEGITMDQVLGLLRQDLAPAISAVRELVKVDLTQNQQDALLAFIFNSGTSAFASSTLLKELNQGRYDQVPVQLLRWTKAGGKEIPGLVLRRNREIELWNKK